MDCYTVLGAGMVLQQGARLPIPLTMGFSDQFNQYILSYKGEKLKIFSFQRY